MRKTPEWKDSIFILLAFCMMILLYFSSSMSYQDQNVQPFLARFLSGEPLKGLLERVQFSYAGNEVSIQASGYAGFIEFFIRKAAHFGSFFLLGTFWFLGLKNKSSSYVLAALVALLLAAGYASFDELRQSFNPNRTALMEDVFLDSLGAMTGISISWIMSRNFLNNKSKRKKLKFR
ncbi:VanZ family protein [Marinilactibacillus psychrotolerans]|uniref:Membrane protein n=2 Tax=Marinilactibacillus psychrotolerans TaxID=191770 RepID=A0A511H2Q5_9LACT|nr:VanZ family protein [Marinilactibacillus psychrotolerans]TLQ07614.1 VanZ family protein [Marinilactibacillus psychrotolerans]SDD19078.1 VanZ like family protein [Marinilactibacillus psychrotolerans]SJN18344.1 conserved domain protein [Marinilactibacillus psychrotolerans 42ea]GEL67797.1 membrane protein [Marinilactibacillus psychrotolerans]GEQ32210.1 membrane protein [Marinilactibacillus psychrotolerans]